MDPQKIAGGMMAGSLLMMLALLLFYAAWFGFFLASLIHCLKHKRDKDRLTWVIVIIFVPIIGGILYFTIGRSESTPDGTRIPRYDGGENPPPFVDPMADEKKRAAAIAESLSAMSASRHRPK